MKNDVLDVLMYIFERFQDQDYMVIDESNELAAELTEVGFGNVEIDSALDWLDGLIDVREQNDQIDSLATASSATRIFSEQECLVLNQKSRGLIYHLEQLGVLDSQSRELIIDRIMALDMPDVSQEQVKWICMMVLCNLPGRESACAFLENLDNPVH